MSDDNNQHSEAEAKLWQYQSEVKIKQRLLFNYRNYYNDIKLGQTVVIADQ